MQVSPWGMSLKDTCEGSYKITGDPGMAGEGKEGTAGVSPSGKERIRSWMSAARAASCTSSSVARMRP